MAFPTGTTDGARPSTLVTRVRLRNFRSIVACDVRLGPLTILVGPNGSGKSNFLDALRFLSGTFKYGIDHSIRVRGLAEDVIPRSAGAVGADEFGIELDMSLPNGAFARLSFALRVRSLGGSEVRREACALTGPDPSQSARYEVSDGELVRWESPSLPEMRLAPPRSRNYLYLFNLAGFPEFHLVSEAIRQMEFYNVDSSLMRAPRLPESSTHLHADGSNIASILRQMQEKNPGLKRRLDEYVVRIIPGVHTVEAVRTGQHIALEFRQSPRVDAPLWRFLSDQMSEGTLRSLGVLVALFQARTSAPSPVSLVAIEEPENGLHPAAIGVLLDALMDASETTQILVTSHSSDLLDRVDPEEVTLLAVSSENGATKIGSVDRVGRTAIRERLYTPASSCA